MSLPQAALPTRYGQPIRQPGYSLPPGFEDAGAIAAQQLSAHHQQQMQQQAVMRGTMQPQRAASVAGPASAIEAPIKTEQNQQQSDSIVASPSGQGQGQNKPSPTNTAQPVNVPQRTASMPVLGQQQQSATPQMQQHQAVAQGSGPQQVQMVNGQPQIIQTLQYRGPPQQNAMGPQQIQQVQGVQGQPVGYPPGMVQIQGARTAVPAGQAQRRYAVSGYDSHMLTQVSANFTSLRQSTAWVCASSWSARSSIPTRWPACRAAACENCFRSGRASSLAADERYCRTTGSAHPVCATRGTATSRLRASGTSRPSWPAGSLPTATAATSSFTVALYATAASASPASPGHARAAATGLASSACATTASGPNASATASAGR